jgi:endonuclease/exonuclease/phosphatase family metal-dependent hydrolase
MSHLICNFNVNNLFIRYRFGSTFPGDISGKSLVEDPAFGYLPIYDNDLFELYKPVQRELAARVITNNATVIPDVVCLQEVESLLALRRFNEDYLDGVYKLAMLVDSRDFRQIDVGILSRLPILDMRSHVDDRDPSAPANSSRPWLFSRDCFEVTIRLTASKTLTLFINHLKSKFIDPETANTPAKRAAQRKKDDKLRKRQATRGLDIVKERFPGQQFQTELFAVVGDLNDEPASGPLSPLFVGSGLTDALTRIAEPTDRWTHWFRSENSVSQMDAVLLSSALATATANKIPRIERRGISYSRILQDGGIGPKVTHFQVVDDDPNPVPVDFRFARFPDVTTEVYASDHCPVFFTVP